MRDFGGGCSGNGSEIWGVICLGQRGKEVAPDSVEYRKNVSLWSGVDPDLNLGPVISRSRVPGILFNLFETELFMFLRWG